MDKKGTKGGGAEPHLSSKKLRAAYWELNEADEVVLMALSMLGSPLSTDQVISLCECLQTAFGSRLSFQHSIPRLLGSGLVEPTTEGSASEITQVTAIAELGPWGMAASRHRRWDKLAHAGHGYVAAQWGQLDADSVTQFVRFAVAASDLQLASTLLQETNASWLDACVSVARDAVEGNVACIHPSLWRAVHQTLQHATPDAPETAHLFHVLDHALDAPDDNTSVWPPAAVQGLRAELEVHKQRLCLFRGDLEQGERSCELPEGGITALGLAFRWLRGADDTAAYIERRMAGPTGGKKKFKPTWPDSPMHAWGEAFYALALIADGSGPRLKEAHRLTKTARKHAAAGQPLAGQLEELASRLLDKPFRPDPRYLFEPEPDDDALTELLSVIAEIWAPKDALYSVYDDDDFLDAEELFETIEAYPNAPWLQRQWLAILKRVDGERAERARNRLGNVAVPPPGELSLVDLVADRSTWEAQFEAIERTLSEEPESAQEAEQRLAWFVRVGGPLLEIEPRLQKRKGNGYTRGRRVALKRLAEGDAPCPLSAQDQRVIGCIRAEMVPRRYGYYTQTEYELGQDALVQLVGHPAVYDPETNGPLVVQEGTPQISLAEDGEGLRFVVVPPSADPVSYTMQGGILVVYSLDKKQQDLFGKVLKAGRFPHEARTRATRLLEGMSTTVHTLDDKKALGDVRNVPAEPAPVFQLEPHRGGLRVQAVVRPFGPDGPSFSPGAWPESVRWDSPEGASLAATRDLDRESLRLGEMLDACPVLAHYLGGRPQLQAEIEDTQDLLEVVTELDSQQASLEWPEGQKIRLKHARRGKVQITNVRENNWLEAQMTVELNDGDHLEQLELLQALRKGERFIALADGSFVELEKTLRSRLQRMDAFTSPDDETGLYHPFAALELEQDENFEVVGTESWQWRRDELATRMHKKIRLPSGLQADLRDYQKEGVRWALRLANLDAGACLADDMGLGKTVQALAVLLARAKEGPALVLAPSSVIGNWRRETAEFAPGLRVTVLSELAGRGSEGRRKLPKLKPKDVLLSTYDLTVREIDALREVQWASLVVDEAQAIKNPDTRRARAVVELNASFRMALSGTPVENHLGELWSLFRVLNPTLLGNRRVFETRFQKPIEQSKDSTRLEQLKMLISPFLLRRTKEDVLSSLPPRTEVTWEVQLSKAERNLYEAARLDAIERLEDEKETKKNPLQILKELLRLRQLCCHPRLALPNSDVPSSKHAALMELLEELRENGHRALVFSQFVQHLSLVRELLDSNGFSYQYLDGSTPSVERTRRIEAFQQGVGELFLISLKAGGTGINLTAADYVIHLDPWWNPAVEDQASDRAHRIGQSKPVTVYRLVAKDTIEEKLVALHASKRELADQVLSGGQAAALLSSEELLRLMTGG